MSSYIIAGSADSIDTAYCEEIARRIQAKYKNIDFRVIIKHPSEWDEYLQQICRIYGFLNKSNPIVYTLDGKIIGNRDAFMATASKYFGLDEVSLLIPNISNKVNMKQAEQQLARKKVIKNNIRTLTEKIEDVYNSLLNKKILKLDSNNNTDLLYNGIEYCYGEVSGLCKDMVFEQEMKVRVVVEDVKPEDIDLMALSLNDQVKPEEPGKQTFVTNNNPIQPIIQERMSEASKTNRLQESIMSYDNNSKGVKQSSSKLKSRIDEQFDDLTDYVDYPLHHTVVCDLGENFYLAFQSKTYIKGQMIIYHNEDTNGNVIRIYNDGRPVQGHRAFIMIEENPVEQQSLIQKQEVQSVNQEKQQQNNQNQQIQQVEKQVIIQKVKQQKIEKSKPVEKDPSIVSEDGSQNQLISNINYHTLFINKPLSLTQLKTNCISTLQFLPDNPNPKIKVYHRKFLSNNPYLDLPIQIFISKKIQQQQYQIIRLGKQNSVMFDVFTINDIGFRHYYYPHDITLLNEQLLSKVIKHVVNEIVSQQQKTRKQIGYNLLISKKYTLIVPIIEPYRVYNNVNFYFDGLAYLGLINVAKVTQPYSIKKLSLQERKKQIISAMGTCSGHIFE